MTGKTNMSRGRRKAFTFVWITALALLIVILIYREMTAVLYILATLGVTALLIVVAMTDLGHTEKISSDQTSNK